MSAYNYVISGILSLVGRYPWIDKDHMGLQGQSWGGYETAYIITQTDMFAAAMAGAPVSNMTSAYGGIRWTSGYSRMFQYEKGPSRIGGTLWDRTTFVPLPILLCVMHLKINQFLLLSWLMTKDGSPCPVVPRA